MRGNSAEPPSASGAIYKRGTSHADDSRGGAGGFGRWLRHHRALAAIPAGASEVDTATVDVTAPLDAVTLQPGTTNSLITINVQLTGNQDGTAGFDIYTDYDMHNGAFFATGAYSHFTIGPRAAQDPAFITSVQGHLSVSPSEPTGVYPMSIFASNITNSNQTGAKLKVGTVSTYKVTVVPLTDVTPPSLFLPTEMHVSAQDSSGATVSYTATAHDNLDGIVAVNCSPASGSTFPIGTTSVNCSATDSHDNTANGSFSMVVSDTTAPVVTVPADITKQAAGPSGAQVTYIATSSDAVDGMITPTCDTPSGSMFPLGTTTVTCSAQDAAGNTGSASFHVTVQDTTPPTLTPYNATVEATGPTTPTSFGASVMDLVDGSVPVTCDHASGSGFPVGQTTVNCTATDAHGNTASGTLTVTVTDTTPPTITMPSDMSVKTNGNGQAADIETNTTSVPGLTYDASANQYVYVWKTDKAWAGMAKTLRVMLADGSVHQAVFAFTR
jgi:HYR domain-containing protein